MQLDESLSDSSHTHIKGICLLKDRLMHSSLQAHLMNRFILMSHISLSVSISSGVLTMNSTVSLEVQVHIGKRKEGRKEGVELVKVVNKDTYTCTLSLTLSLSLSLSLSRARAHALSITLTHSHTHTHTCTLYMYTLN